MFGLRIPNILSLFYTQARLKSKYTGRRRLANPGIEKRLKISEKDAENFDDDDDLNYELDVNSPLHDGRVTQKETRQQRERLKMLITRQKYFNVIHPNFLTWQEKEQIRYLHHTDPEEWSAEKLSDSFPALPDTIKKIIASQWRPSSEQRIINHNKNVNENWLKLKHNQLGIDNELKEHLKKFMDRKTVDTILENNPKPVEHVHKRPMKTEFQDLVKPSIETTDITPELPGGNHLVQIPKFIENQHITLEALQSVTPHQNVVSEVDNTSKRSKLSELTVNITSESFKLPEDGGYAEVIQIPKKVWVKGKTYRVADCYYDDDGEFLYRVPGMTKNI